MEKEIAVEAFNLLCGERIGRGLSREVFEIPMLPGCVAKVEAGHDYYQNILEWKIWERVKDTPASRWFAECRWISPNGHILIMERTRPPTPKEFPDRVPVWFTDLKRQNWGVATDVKGKDKWLVCHDYGTCLVIQEGTSTKRMKKADWWNEGE